MNTHPDHRFSQTYSPIIGVGLAASHLVVEYAPDSPASEAIKSILERLTSILC